MKVLSIVFIFAFLASCSGATSNKEKLKSSYQVETAPQQALKEVMATPTNFFVPLSESTASWERTRMFFQIYLGMPSLRNAERNIGPNTTYILGTGPKYPKYQYEVQKELYGQGYKFNVTCKTRLGGGTTAASMRNARNLARFIKEGTLETTLLQ